MRGGLPVVPFGGGPRAGVDLDGGAKALAAGCCCKRAGKLGSHCQQGPGVLRRDVGGLEKLSGISFQLFMFVAFEGGGIEGDALTFRCGGGPSW